MVFTCVSVSVAFISETQVSTTRLSMVMSCVKQCVGKYKGQFVSMLAFCEGNLTLIRVRLGVFQCIPVPNG